MHLLCNIWRYDTEEEKTPTFIKSVWTLWAPVAKIGRNAHIFFAFGAICINNILNENAHIFRKSQGPEANVIFDSTKLNDM